MLEPGTLVAGYRVERVLGSGGMGAVFLARHPELPRYDALKVLKASAGLTDSNFRRRFLREAEVAATLDHPNIVTVFNRGRASVPTTAKSGASSSASGESDLLWIAMQYVPGTDCARELAARGPFAPRRVVHIVSEVARGIDHANRRGLFHRDVKPANILLAEVDEDSSFDEQRVLLTDFGVAKLSDETEALTSVGTVLATLSYASPEQLTGRRLDGRTDQYSLAASTFHLLTGRVPFDDRDNGAVIGAHLKEPVPRISDLVPAVPPAADAVIAKAMAKRPDERFATCREFADALATSLRTVRPRSVADLDAETVPGTPRPPAARGTPVPPRRAARGERDRRPRDQAAAVSSADDVTLRAMPGRPGPRPPTGRASPNPATPNPVTPNPTPRSTPPARSQPGSPRSQTARPATGADPAVWQHPPSNPLRQSNDHLRAQPGAGRPRVDRPRAGRYGADRSPGSGARYAVGGPVPPGPVGGPVPPGASPHRPGGGSSGAVGDAGSGGRGASNRSRVILAVVAVVAVILIVVLVAAL
ncbi:protein kinase domain-containing protein [Gordonia terrae]|uniref:serine/threonine-protein kinase n=1 Tax=Gordonia terrae TaxID=2055 RepID=UPI003F6B4ACE